MSGTRACCQFLCKWQKQFELIGTVCKAFEPFFVPLSMQKFITLSDSRINILVSCYGQLSFDRQNGRFHRSIDLDPVLKPKWELEIN